MLSDDFTEMASESPLAFSKRLSSTSACASACCRPDRPSRSDSPPLAPPKWWLKNQLWWMCTFFAMPLEPGPLICRYTPAVDLLRNALWSTSLLSADTVTRLPLRLLAKVLRVMRTAAAAGGTVRLASPVNVKPSTTTLDTVPNRIASASVSRTPPVLRAAMVMGAVAVPDRVSVSGVP